MSALLVPVSLIQKDGRKLQDVNSSQMLHHTHFTCQYLALLYTAKLLYIL